MKAQSRGFICPSKLLFVKQRPKEKCLCPWARRMLHGAGSAKVHTLKNLSYIHDLSDALAGQFQNLL
jgi:hypothetical protein